MRFDVSALLPAVYLGLGVASAAELEEWTLADLYDFANEELDRLSGAYALFVDGSDELAVVAHQANNAYPEGRIATLLVALDGGLLSPANVQEIESRSDNWEAAEATPTHFIDDFLNLWRLYPAPLVAGTASMLYLYDPAPITAAQTLLDVPSAIGDLFTLRAIAEARRRDCDSQMPEAAEVCEQILKLYDSALKAYWGGGA